MKTFKNTNNYYDIMNIRFDEDTFAKKTQGINKIYHEVLLSMKFPQTKPQNKNMNNNYYDLYYTVNKNRKEKILKKSKKKLKITNMKMIILF